MIGYYVHHHGAGHLARALTIAGAETNRFTLLGTGLAGRTGHLQAIDLEDDRPLGATGFDGADGSESRPQALHYGPLHHGGVRRRTARLAGWIATTRPSLLVVDVSVEVAMLARLASTPTVVVRLTGDRTDPAHLDAFRGAAALLSPFHPDLEAAATPDWVRRKTRYAPRLGPPAAKGAVNESVVLVVFGAGGGEADGEALARAARLTPELSWRVLGPMSDIGDSPSNLKALGWVDDVAREIAAAGVVIGSAGNGVVGAVLAAGRPFVCLPQPRPYDEQTSTARGLEAQGAAVVVTGWPQAEAWPGLLMAARALKSGARRRLLDGDGAGEIRGWLHDLAASFISRSGTPS